MRQGGATVTYGQVGTRVCTRLPYVARWVKEQGWIEMRQDDFSRSFVRALDIGGMVWEGAPNYPGVNVGIEEWLREQEY